MIKNLIVSGCSFTDNRRHPTWVDTVAEQLTTTTVINLGRAGAGNAYISQSVIDCLTRNHFAPTETMVIVMWSGPDRHDVRVAGDYWYLLEDYHSKTNIGDPDGYWVFSGGRSNSWIDHVETRKLFLHHYTTIDPVIMCSQTLYQILMLSVYLEHQGFSQYFMSHLNYWDSDPSRESVTDGSLNVAFFCRNLPIFQCMAFDRWIFSNNNKDSIYEFCRDRDLLSADQFHPSAMGHKLYAEQIIAPYLERKLA